MNYTELYGNTSQSQTKHRYDKLRDAFTDRFNALPAAFFSSPARCEIVGNHTDHNNGRVLVGALNRDIIACAAPNGSSIINIFTENFGNITVDITKTEYQKSEEGSSLSIVKGMIAIFKADGYKYGGFDAFTNSNIPAGVGMSSSAAFEMLICVILNDFFNGGKLMAMQRAKICQRVENEYFGKPCGLLDQCGIAYGGVTYIDFVNPLCPYVETVSPIKLVEKMLLINTGGDHSDLTQEYVAIKNDMQAVAESFGKKYLGEITEKEFFSRKEEDTLKYKRALHFFEENRRVKNTLNFCKLGDNEMFLICIANSGHSSRYNLRNCTKSDETSSPITKALDDLKILDPTCVARVHGGGFRGTVLAYVKNDEKILNKINDRFGAENVMEIEFRKYGTTAVKPEKIFGE
ncbi:MAG TPA: galactokinase family protein [Clostridia bacterium]|nr:galactokinase family protein [Clostridia bacterium]